MLVSCVPQAASRSSQPTLGSWRRNLRQLVHHCSIMGARQAAKHPGAEILMGERRGELGRSGGQLGAVLGKPNAVEVAPKFVGEKQERRRCIEDECTVNGVGEQ